MENEKLLVEELNKAWNEDRASGFVEYISQKIDDDQFEALCKMIPFIVEANKEIDEEGLEALTPRLDTFDGAREFIEYFFTQVDANGVEAIMKGIDEDSEEIDNILETLQDQGVIDFYGDFDGFYVWYKG